MPENRRVNSGACINEMDTKNRLLLAETANKNKSYKNCSF